MMFYSFNQLIVVLTIANTINFHMYFQLMKYYLLLIHVHGIFNRLIKQKLNKLICLKIPFLVFFY